MIKVDSMDKEINKILEEYNGRIDDALHEVIAGTTKDCVEELKTTSPVNQDAGAKTRGQYAKLWRSKIIENVLHKYTSVVYNYQWQLTHLLENGHNLVSKTGKIYGHAKAYPHIKPAEEHAIENYERDLRKVINDIK